MDFSPSKLFKCATFKNSLKYIIKRKNTYYLCIKIKKKVVKYSLKTDDVEFAKYLRNLIVKKLKGFLKMTPDDLRKSLMDEFKETTKKSSINDMLNYMLNDKYSVSYTIDVKPNPNNPEETEEMAEKIAKELASKYNLFSNNQTTPLPQINNDY